MTDHHANVQVRVGSERSFGVVFACVFFIIGVWPFVFGGGDFRLVFLAIAVVFLALAFVAPNTLRVPNRLWFKLGMLLGAIVAPIVMALVYLTTFVPIGIAVRLLGKDLLSTKIDPELESYWIAREKQPGSMKQQF
ncbi:MAG: hypothetical protein KUG70_06265 [Rhodobacteraceae bacterium]|nr:hypothetical protein [Paracoccaceae bacterium]